MKRSEAIKAFLAANAPTDLANLYSLEMECQVNVAQDSGDRITGEYHGRPWHGYTDGMQTWKAFRIPRNANTEPEYVDVDMAFSLTEHAEGVGMTGWDWKNKVSRWVAFDFDAITGHKEAHSKKLSEEELNLVQQTACDIPWVTVRKSAGGRGLHLYVFLLHPEPTANHNEHAALARAILGTMSSLAKMDFNTQVDICGQNMWVWHRKAIKSGGLELIKAGGYLEKIPPNWRDHIEVVRGTARKSLPKFLKDASVENSSILDSFGDLVGQSSRVQLDDDHRRLLKFLEENATGSWWDADHNMLVTHTWHLKVAHERLNFKGDFSTIAMGQEAPTDINAFLFPLRRGGWVVRRYSMGVSETTGWDQDGRGWTRCYYNIEPNLRMAARVSGGMENTSGAFVFKEAESAVEAARKIGASIGDGIPAEIRTARAEIKEMRDGRIAIKIEHNPDAVIGSKMQGWLLDKGKWVKIFNVQAATPLESEVSAYDDFVRHLVTQAGDDYGWVIKGEGNSWKSEPLNHVKVSLESLNLPNKDVKNILGQAVLKPWSIVNRPFQPEFPGNREWNRNSAQLKFLASQKDTFIYPTWLKILEHCGRGLNDAVGSHPWARANGIRTGADYLKLWLASLFREPYQPLPYLFFYGEQNCGKSLFHEAVSLLLTQGYKRADHALMNQQGFNEEIANAIVCVVEEVNLRKNKEASNRIKDWVTARDLAVHPKGKTPYQIPNTTHWIQCANESQACPVFPGDTRITMIPVMPLDPTEMIPKKIIMPMLEKEAADFLGELYAVELPPSNDRLNVPVIVTAEKAEAERMNETPLQAFIRDKCHAVSGARISIAEFYEAFQRWCDPTDLNYWTKIRVGREMPQQFPKGRAKESGHFYYGNISFTPFTPGDPVLPKLKAATEGKDVYLVPEGT